MVTLPLLRQSKYRALPRPPAKWKYALWFVIVLAGLTLPSVFPNTKAEQFWLPAETSSWDGTVICHLQSITLTVMQGPGVSGTVVSDNPIYVMVVSSSDHQGMADGSTPCEDVPTLGFVNSGSTTNYMLQFTAPYSVNSGDPFYITFVNLGSSDAMVTINLTTW